VIDNARRGSSVQLASAAAAYIRFITRRTSTRETDGGWDEDSGGYLCTQPGQPPPGTQQHARQAVDEMLEDLIVIRLAERTILMPFVKVSVENGVAALSGNVPDEVSKNRALRIAASTRGVQSVRDRMSVDASVKKIMSERQHNVSGKEIPRQVAENIAMTVEGAKAGRDRWADGWRVEGQHNTWSVLVEPGRPGVIVLQGEVPSLEIMHNAVEAARQVAGAHVLHSHLRVAPQRDDRSSKQ
jgi:osmotically-inducible protein OsmY